jgi:hypothetical protein
MLSGCTTLEKRNIGELLIDMLCTPAQGRFELLFRKAQTLFATMEEEIGYLEDRNLDDALVDLLIRHGKKSDAAKVHLSEGRILQAIDLFLDDNFNRQDSIHRATNCVLQGLRKAMPLGGSVAGLETSEIFKRSDLLGPWISSQDVRDEVTLTILCFHLFTPTVQDRYVQSHKLRMHGRLHQTSYYFFKLG